MSIQFFILITLISTSLGQKVIKIGASITSMNATDEYMVFTTPLLSGYIKGGIELFQYWFEHYHNNITKSKDGTEYTLEFIYKEDNYSDAEEIFRQLACDEGADFLIAGFGTNSSVAAANAAADCNATAFGPSTVSKMFYQGNSRAFPLYVSGFSQITSRFTSYRIAGAKSVMMMKPHFSPAPHSCLDLNGPIKDEFGDNFTELIYVNDETPVNETEIKDNFTAVVDMIIKEDRDILLYCGFSECYMSRLVNEFKRRNYTPRGGISATQEETFPGSDVNYWTFSSVLLTSTKPYPEDPYIGNATNYLKVYDECFPTTPPFDNGMIDFRLSYFGFIAGEIILSSIEGLSSFDGEYAADYIRRSQFNSIIGRLEFASDNSQLNPGASFQQLPFAPDSIVISPNSIANGTLVYPMPTWEERVRSSKYRVIEILLMVVLAIFIINSIGWAIYLFLNRHDKIIHVSSPIFLAGMLFGSILIYISIYLWIPNISSKATCIAMPWFLACGFMFLFGSMLVKSWRIHVLFSNKSLEVFKISNLQVGIFLCILLSIDVILLIIWTSASSPNAIEMIPDMYRPSLNYYVCKTNSLGKIVLWILVGYNILLVIYGGYLALRIRTIPYKIYDESKIIAFCIYNVGLVSIIVAILIATDSIGRYTLFGLCSFLMILSSAITINVMFAGKIIINQSDASSKSSSAISSTSNSSKMESVEMKNVEEDYQVKYEKLLKKFKKLKKENKEFKEALDGLKQE